MWWSQVLPLLGSALEFGAAPACALGPYLQIANKLPRKEFEKNAIPVILKLFASQVR